MAGAIRKEHPQGGPWERRRRAAPALLIERLSPRLPGLCHLGVFEESGPGNDGGSKPQ